MKSIIKTVPVQTFSFELQSSKSFQKKSESREKTTYHVRNSIMVRNKNQQTLESQKKSHRHRLSLNLKKQQKVEKNTRKGAYTPEIFKNKESIESSKSKIKSQARSEMFSKKNKQKKAFDIQNIFPTRKIHHNKYFKKYFRRGPIVNQNMNYSCTYHNHVPAINPQYLESILSLESREQEGKEESKQIKKVAMTERVNIQQISPWKTAREYIHEFE